MREKKEYIIIAFKTTTSAMAMEKTCIKQGIPGRIIPLPSMISAGCGLSWRMLLSDYETFKDSLSGLSIPFESVHRIVM